uniref:VWFA domain-containing protein n=1 Tax=Branchiostoma floridae TaxID=7739 RepID=C3XQR8_BRAFL|eukprot:XP_002613635.1 hypothetical protein BRAFLDRAFT_93676 [Branchiostoma floridae]
MTTKVILVVFLAALPCLCFADLSTAPITTTWIPKVSRKMVKFAESQTGALQLVKAYDEKLNFTEIQIDGVTQLNLLTQSSGDRLKKCREILERNKADIEASHAQGPTGGAPASDCCDNLGQLEYDPRNWYVSAASPKKKNVVIVIDVSGSMREPPGPEEQNRLNLAKQAALTVLDTLTPRDWGGVVSFSARAETPEGCLGDSLGEANPTNIGIMQDFINQRVPETITMYGVGFRKAFDMFAEARNKKPEQFEDCYNIIIFLSDGSPTDKAFALDEITKGQELMDRSVYIFTYGLGANLMWASSQWAPDPNNPFVYLPALDFLRTIADQNNRQIPGAVEWTNAYCTTEQNYGLCFSQNRDPQGVGPWGRMEYIDDGQGDKLKTIMGSYYDFFPFSSDPEPTYSVPTNDEHLDGRVLIHRNLPKPMEWLSEPTFLGLEAMESALRSRERTKIMNGDSGDYYTMVKVPIARGNAQFDGAVTIEKAATFYYEPIPDTKYSVVLCLFEDDETIAIPTPVNPENGTDALYHRLDLLYMNNATGDTQFCSLYGEYATPDDSTIKFPPEAFTDPINYLNTLETFEDVVDIEMFINDFTGSWANPGLIEGIRTDVILSAEIEQYWRENGTESVWRYFGTENGVFRIFPGIITDKRYDPTRQTCYFMESLDNTTIYYLSTFTNNTRDMEHDHLTHRFPWLAKELIMRGEYLRNSQLFYDTTGFIGLEVTTGPLCNQYALHPINSTNTFILTLHNRHTYNCDDRPIIVGGNQNCSCNDICQTCSTEELQVCQCPCVCDWYYESCTNEILRLLSDIPCPPPPEDLTARGPGPPYPPEPEVEECEEKCSAQSDNITCEALPHCVWCEELDFPVCTEICLTREKFPVSVFFPCVNLTELSRDEQEELKENFYLRVVQLLPNVTQEAINFPENVTENTIEFMLQGEMNSPPPDESIALLRQQTSWRQNFTVGPHRDPAMFRSADPEDYTDLKITLYFNNVNFTTMLSNDPTSDTRRNIVDQITELVNNTLSPEVSVTSDNMWMEQNYIPFTIDKPIDSPVLLMDEFRKLEEKVRNVDPQTIVTVEGTDYPPDHIGVEGSFYQLCPQSCDLGLSKDDCDDIPSCNWEDFIPPQECSSNSYLVESVSLTAYFPCDDLTILPQWQQDEVIDNFKINVLSLVPGLADKAIHSVQILKDPNFIGSQISFTLQATMSDPYILDTYNLLKDAFNKINRFTVGPKSNPTMYLAHGSGQNSLDYTDLRIVLKFRPGTDFDAVLQASPLTARDAIETQIRALASTTFITLVASTVSDMWLEEDIIPLMIHKAPDSAVSLQQEADKLEPEVVAGRVRVTVDGQTYTAVSMETEGSFETICPRPCTDGTDEADCVQIPGCDWGDFDTPQVCSDNSLLADRIEIGTLFPCADFGSLSATQQGELFRDFKNKLHVMLPGVPDKAIDINSFRIVDDDTITFVLQGTMQHASLQQYYSTIRQELEWARDFRIGTTANPNSYRSRGLDDFTNLRVQLIFDSTLNLDPLLENDLTLRDGIRAQMRNNLVRAGVQAGTLATLGDIWMEKNVIPFTISKPADDPTSLLDEANKLDIKIAANSAIFNIDGATWRPVDMIVNGSFDVLCPQQCQDGTDRDSCTLIPGCDWADYDNPVTCLDDAYLVEHIDMSAYFPCLFVPVNLNGTSQLQQDVADSFLSSLRAALQNRGFQVPEKVIHAVQVGRDTIDFRIQSTMGYQNLTGLRNAIRDILSWDQEFTFDGFRSANPDDKFNNTVKFEISFEDQNGGDIDFDAVLESNFTLRDVLEQDIINFVIATLGPSPVATLNLENIWIQSNYCTFSISVPLDQVHAIGAEALQIVNNIGNFIIHVGSLQIQAIKYETTESCDFCPPVCAPRDELACYQHTLCEWCVFEGSPHCGADCLLQEETKEELSVFFPCLPEVIDHQTELQIQNSFRDEVLQLLRDNFNGFNTSRNIFNVTIANRTVSFSLKSSMLQRITPEIISFLRNVSNWSGVTLRYNGNQYPVWDPNDYTDIKFFLRFDAAHNFTEILSHDFTERRRLEDAVRAMVNRSVSSSVLPAELAPTVANIWAKDGECVAVPSCGWCTLNEGPGCGDDCYLVEWVDHFAFIPCEQTRDLTPEQRQQLEDRFRLEVAAILGSTDKIIRNVAINDSGISFELQATMQDRFLPEYEEKIRDAFELAANFTVGDVINPGLFRTRDPKDFTDIVVNMTFIGVDFENLGSHSVSMNQLHTSLKKVLTDAGISSQYLILQRKLGQIWSGNTTGGCWCCPVNPLGVPDTLEYDPVAATGQLSSTDKVGMGVGIPVALAALAGLGALLMFFLKRKPDRPPTPIRRNVVAPAVESFETNIYSASMDDELSYQFGKKGAELHRFRDPNAVYGRLSSSWSPYPSTASSSSTMESSLSTPDVY